MAPTVTLSLLSPSEKERLLDFLAERRVEFVATSGGRYAATVRVVQPPAGIGLASLQGGSLLPREPVGLGRTAPSSLPTNPKRVAAAAPSDAGSVAKSFQAELQRKYRRFCGALQDVPRRVKDMPLSELTRFIEGVYIFRFEQEVQRLKLEAANAEAEAKDQPLLVRPGRAPPGSFPGTVSAYAGQRLGLPRIVAQLCWGMVSGVDKARKESVAVELFGRFLEESYDLTDLLFYLNARDVTVQAARREPQELQQALTGTATWRAVSHGLPNKKLHGDSHELKSGKDKVVPQRVSAKLALKVVRDCVAHRDMQDRIIKDRLDPVLLATEDHTLDTHVFLKVLAEEFHAARGSIVLPADVAESIQEGKTRDFLQFVDEAQMTLEDLFAELDASQSGVVARADFVRALEDLGFRGDAGDVWTILDPGAAGTVAQSDFLLLGQDATEAPASARALASDPHGAHRAQLTVTLSVKGLDYAKLSVHPSLLSAVQRQVRQAVQYEGDEEVRLQDVSCVLSQGTGGGTKAVLRIHVRCDPGEFAAKLRNSVTLGSYVVEHLQLDRNQALKDLTTGPVRVSIVDVGNPIVTAAPSARRAAEAGQHPPAQVVPSVPHHPLLGEAAEIAKKLRFALGPRGEGDEKKENIHNWSVAVASLCRRAQHDAQAPNGSDRRAYVSLGELQQAWQGIFGGSDDSLVSEATLQPVEQTNKFEANLRKALAHATEDLAAEIAREQIAAGSAGAGDALLEKLIAALSPKVTALAEALLQSDRNAWLACLGAKQDDKPAEALFADLQGQLLRAKASQLDAALKHCMHALVAAAEVNAVARACAAALPASQGREVTSAASPPSTAGVGFMEYPIRPDNREQEAAAPAKESAPPHKQDEPAQERTLETAKRATKGTTEEGVDDKVGRQRVARPKEPSAAEGGDDGGVSEVGPDNPSQGSNEVRAMTTCFTYGPSADS